jgi:membrane-associated protease RseP (regulator of RpoE activity)
MTMRTLTLAAALAIAGLLGAPPTGAAGQSVGVEQANRLERGWIGISFDVLTDRQGRIREIVISDVSPDSPAQEAGLRPGDQILAINEFDEPEELADLAAHLRLKPGDDVVMEIHRDGRARNVQLEAATRPDAFLARSTIQLSLEADSMVETWVRAMDSLRVELVSERNGRVQVRRIGSGSGSRIAVIAERAGEVATSTRAVRAPFEFFVFRGESHDSLRREMLEVNRVSGELEEMLAQRERQLRRRAGASTTLDFDQDYEFRQLNEALRQVEDRSSELEEAMAEAARQTAGFQYMQESRAPTDASAAERDVSKPGEYRPLTPYLLGRNRVAGAEVIDLKPELAQYFGVERGVLVVDVAAGTPASLAGIVPGDVITQIDQVGVRSVEDLRFGVSMAGDTLPIFLVRQGTSVQVLLRR